MPIDTPIDMPIELQTAIADLRNYLRPDQRKMSYWQDGEMAVSAVPGAGKSTGMATLAAIAILEHNLNRNHQLIIVTFTRAAANNIRSKVNQKLAELLREPRLARTFQTAFIANTLHGLAFSIAGSHRELAGFSENETKIISESQKLRLVRLAIAEWIRNYPQQYNHLIAGRSFDGEESERLRRQTVLRTDILPSLALEIISTAKSSQLLPQNLQEQGEILETGAGLYETYNKLLKAEQAIDYDDMIIGSLRVLENPTARQLWQERTFAVFEDEAQDSSPLQTQLLKQLATKSDNNANNSTNLVRVGDPNQAINSTFTTADPSFFAAFCQRAKQVVTIAQAGRSCMEIINAANYVLDWVNTSYYAQSREKPFLAQHITPVGDANPSALGLGLEIQFPEDIDQTMAVIKQRIINLLAEDANLAIAILVRNHNQGKYIYRYLSDLKDTQDIKVYDVEDRDRSLKIPKEMLGILQFIERPHSPDNLKACLQILLDRQLIKPQDFNALASLPEQFLYPTPLDRPFHPQSQIAQSICRSLLRSRMELPLYNLIAFIALTLNYNQGELATADKLSDRLRQELVGTYNIANLLSTLQEIVLSEKFEVIEIENPENQYTQPAQVTIISLHKSKGLDWDVVFIPFMDERICPGKPYIPEPVKFLGDFNLPEVARMQMRALINQEELPDSNSAWLHAQTLKQFEEFRLLYMGMTRPKRLLHISASTKAPFSWNNLDSKSQFKPCPAIAQLAQKFPQSVVPCSHLN
ncbi:DNA/RNA helicase, superfamily I [Synechococcus sp. PCC 7502]|uniref:ATP-dependent helicase n=1 Tax=Synechococcus sp. PCC 7502 TaxID=1173263 RepID=UPI00029FA3D3|nr:ATP-dependent helicase [Synechococcus sp. PCC 7502]AFY75357.1 DNA/RNA helicase, superfamily I [Synechococcus sp. PCC 7502]